MSDILLYSAKLSTTMPLELQINVMQKRVVVNLTSTPSSLTNLSKVNLLDLGMNSLSFLSPIPAGPDQINENLEKFFSIQSRYVPSYFSILLMYFITRLYMSKMSDTDLLLYTTKMSIVHSVLPINVMQERLDINLTSTPSSLNNLSKLYLLNLSLNSLLSVSPFPAGPDQTSENLEDFLSRYVPSCLGILLMYFITRLDQSKMLDRDSLLYTAKLSTLPLVVQILVQERVDINFTDLTPLTLPIRTKTKQNKIEILSGLTRENRKKFLSLQSRYVPTCLKFSPHLFHPQTPQE